MFVTWVRVYWQLQWHWNVVILVCCGYTCCQIYVWIRDTPQSLYRVKNEAITNARINIKQGGCRGRLGRYRLSICDQSLNSVWLSCLSILIVWNKKRISTWFDQYFWTGGSAFKNFNINHNLFQQEALFWSGLFSLVLKRQKKKTCRKLVLKKLV